MSYGTIYGLYHNGELRYIGQTTIPPEQRLTAHLSWAKNHRQSHLCNWLAKLLNKGERPQIKAICEADNQDELNRLEREWIVNGWASGVRLVNACEGGDSGGARPYARGVPRSEETKAKIASAQKGVPRPYAKGPRSAEACANMSAARKGVPQPSLQGAKHHRWDNTIDNERDILTPIREGKTAKEVAAALGKRHTFVHRRLKALGLSMAQLQPPRVIDVWSQVVPRLKTGLSLKAVAVELGTSQPQLSVLLKAVGLDAATARKTP